MRAGAVIFDLDGTLVDSLPDIARAVNQALEGVGLTPWPVEAYRPLVGWGLRRLVESVLERQGADPERAGALTEAVVYWYACQPVTDTVPYPGIPELVGELRARGVPLAVLTNKRQAVAEGVVERLFGSDVFSVIRGELPGLPRKPDPRCAWEVATALGVEAAACWMVGDSAVDMELAARAGMRPVGVAWGFRGVEELGGAEAILERPEQLWNLWG